MPKSLQDKSSLCMLGQHAVDLSSAGLLLSSGMKEDKRNSTCGNACMQNNRGIFRENYGRLTCGCHKLDGLLEQCNQASIRNSNWILVANDFYEQCGGETHWIPKLHHIHWNGELVFPCDVHVCKS